MTKEIISRFRQKPKTNITWWAMGLGLSLFVIPTLIATDLIPKNWDITIGQLNVIPALIFPLLLIAWVLCLLAYRKGERSFVLWLGFGPVILFSTLLLAEIVSIIIDLGF